MDFHQSLRHAALLLEEASPAALREADRVLRNAVASAPLETQLPTAQYQSLVQRIARLLNATHTFYSGVAALRERRNLLYAPGGRLSSSEVTPSFTWEV